MTQNRMIMFVYRFSLFMLVITGFGQMPIFKRYYIADIPGLGWLAQFYTTHLLHYIFAVFFVASITYYSALYLKEWKRLTRLLFIRGTLFLLITITGFLLVLRNFPEYRFSALIITITDIIHLGSVVLLFVFWCVWVIIKMKNKTEV